MQSSVSNPRFTPTAFTTESWISSLFTHLVDLHILYLQTDFTSRHPGSVLLMETIYFSIICIHKHTVDFSYTQSGQLSLNVACLVLLLHLQLCRVGRRKTLGEFYHLISIIICRGTVSLKLSLPFYNSNLFALFCSRQKQPEGTHHTKGA